VWFRDSPRHGVQLRVATARFHKRKSKQACCDRLAVYCDTATLGDAGTGTRIGVESSGHVPDPLGVRFHIVTLFNDDCDR